MLGHFGLAALDLRPFFISINLQSSAERSFTMSRKRIEATEDSSKVLVPQETLEALGVKEGDEIDVSVVDGALVLLPLSEVERARKLDDVIQSVFERRRSAYEELAKGAE